MLIVIVIIGILIAALMPRMQAAQWRARDVSRKTALSQVQSAIVTSQWDKWRWPGCDSNGCTNTGNKWMDVSKIETEIKAAWMTSVPKDPTAWNSCTWLWDVSIAPGWWEYRYLVATRNWAPDWWFALMAKTEVEWWSNRVTCGGSATDSGHWYLQSSDDISLVTLCTTVNKVWEWECVGQSCRSNTWVCCYDTTDELRYLVLY
jgi:hypothetical protein